MSNKRIVPSLAEVEFQKQSSGFFTPNPALRYIQGIVILAAVVWLIYYSVDRYRNGRPLVERQLADFKSMARSPSIYDPETKSCPVDNGIPVQGKLHGYEIANETNFTSWKQCAEALPKYLEYLEGNQTYQNIYKEAKADTSSVYYSWDDMAKSCKIYANCAGINQKKNPHAKSGIYRITK